MKCKKNLENSFAKKLCMVPSELKSQCSNKTPKCHTISKSASLKKIAVENHIYVISPNNDEFYQKMGINESTVFYGFCRKHDVEIFLPIENEKLSISTPKQLFLLGYRALCLRLYKKQASKRFIEHSKIKFIDELYLGVDVAIEDLEFYKRIYDSILLTKDYTKVITILIKLDYIPLVMGTGFIFPEIDLNQKIVNNFDDPLIRPKGFSISCISPPGKNEGIIALSATNDSRNLIETLYEQLKTKEKNANEVLEIIVKLLFLYEENIVFNIQWWDNLSEELKSVVKSMHHVFIQPEDDPSKVSELLNRYYGLFNNTKISSLELIKT